MTKTFITWYRSLSAFQKLLILFVVNSVLWFVFSLILNGLIWSEDKPVEYFAFRAVLLGLLWTLILNPDKRKAAFGREKE